MGVLGAGGWVAFHTYRRIVGDIGRQQRRAADRATSEYYRKSADFDRRYAKQRAAAVDWPSPNRPEAGALLLLESLRMKGPRVIGRWVDGTIDILASDREVGGVVCRVTGAMGGPVGLRDVEALLALSRLHRASPMLFAQRRLDGVAARIVEELAVPTFLLGCTEWRMPEPFSDTARALISARWKYGTAMGNTYAGVVGPFAFDSERWRREDEEDAAARRRRAEAARSSSRVMAARPLHSDELYDGSTPCPSCRLVPSQGELRCTNCGATRRPLPSLDGHLAPEPDLQLTDEAHSPPRASEVVPVKRRPTRREAAEERQALKSERRSERRKVRADERRQNAVAAGTRWKCATCGYRSRPDAAACFMCGTRPD